MVCSPKETAFSYRQLSSSPPTPSDVQKYKSFRLLCLETDPQWFGSTYEAQSKLTDEEWYQRLASDAKVTIVAELEETEDWGGMITVLSSSFFDANAEGYTPSLLRDREMYTLVGMWVHPDHRKKGIGRRLIEEAREWARKRPLEEERRALLLEVIRGNEDGVRLYRRAGFQEVDRNGSNSDEDSIFMFLDI